MSDAEVLGRLLMSGSFMSVFVEISCEKKKKCFALFY